MSILRKSNSKKKLNNNMIPHKIIAVGKISLTYTLILSDEDIKKYKVNYDNLNTIDDLQFLNDNKNLLCKIFLSSDLFTLDLLLNLNRISEEKFFIEYIPFKNLELNEEHKFIQEIINSINELNYLFINSNSELFKESEININFCIKHEDEEKKEKIIPINIETNGNSNDCNKASNEGQDNNDEQSQNKNKLENKIKFNCQEYDSFIIDMKEILESPIGNDICDLIKVLKNKYNSNIVINYCDLSNSFQEDESMKTLSTIYFLCDTFIFNINDALKNFTKHSEKYRTKSSNKEITQKNYLDYFGYNICCNGSLSLLNSKVGIFLDEYLSKINIIEIPLNSRFKNYSYDIKPYPKINHTNIQLIQNFKNIINGDINYYYKIFISGFLSKFCLSKQGKKGIEVIYPSYLSGVKIVKKILKVKIKNIELPYNNKFFQIKLNQKKIDDYISNIESKKQENKFVLDCVNEYKSKMNQYVPLFDNNLQEYFCHKIVNKDLKQKGFLDSKGFVNYDPTYKQEMYKKLAKPKVLTLPEKQKLILKQQLNKKNEKKILRCASPTIVKLQEHLITMNNRIKRIEHSCNYIRSLQSSYKKCQYCELGRINKELENVEEKKRKQMKLRSYENNK